MCQNKTFRCGRIDPACTANNDPDCPDGNCCNEATGEHCTCQELSVCPEFAVQSSAPSVPDAYATLTVGSDVVSENAAPPPAPIYADPPTGGYDCFPGNCWYRMGMYTPPEFSNPGSRPGSHGGGPLKVDFNPEVDFSVRLKPLAFGDSAFTMNAYAKLDAVAAVDLPLLDPISKPVLEMGAGVRAERCNLSTAGAYFKVFGVDFVSMFGNRPFDSGDATSNPGLYEVQAACQRALGAFTGTTDRAKKANRDAQVLIEQYRRSRGCSMEPASTRRFDSPAHGRSWMQSWPACGTPATAWNASLRCEPSPTRATRPPSPRSSTPRGPTATPMCDWLRFAS